RTGVLAIEVEEGSDELAAALGGHGLRVRTDDGRVMVALDDERTFDLVRDATVDLGLALVRMEQRRHRLEDLFREGDADTGAGAAAEGPAKAAAAEAGPGADPPPADAPAQAGPAP
ncbi:MAG: ABC transporter ATP-binding protein, partial [Chloroflexi bacterium]|nr:ABC transporter ATP-binding protein [Chloroflexota bacterium]